MGILFVKDSTRAQNLRSDRSTVFLSGVGSEMCQRSTYLNDLYINTNGSLHRQIEYSVKDQAIIGNDFTIFANSCHVTEYLGEYPAVNLSSIDVGEIWILLRLLSRRELSGIEFYYLTPDSYGGSGVGEIVERKQISISLGQWKGLPGLVTPWNIDNTDFRQFGFLGFDVHRLGSIDSYEGFPDNLNRTFILADPPTAPYWLERSLRDNHELIRDVMQDNGSQTPIERMAGMCPATVNSQLRKIRSHAPRTQRWCLLPLGPKIQTLGAILFSSNQLDIDNSINFEPTVGVLYDFPQPNSNVTEIRQTPRYYWRFRIDVLG